jgi:serine protease Do
MKQLLWIFFVGVSAFFGGSVAVSISPRLQLPVQAQLPPASQTDIVRLSDRFETVARRVSPTVVSVEAVKPGGAAAKTRLAEDSGSGVICKLGSQAGTFVLTNNHVISQARPDQITVSLADGRLYRPARVWADPETDVALLRLDADGLPAAPLGDSDSVRVGQWVLAVGSPFGLSQTVTHGIISARERGQVSLSSTIRIKDFLQTDAAINPGSSGGPLVNLEGEVIGINTAIASHHGNSSGVAFSIPINLVKRISTQLLEKGSISRGYLGMQLAQAFEPADALRLGLDRVQGALVEGVYPDTPAASAGLQANDVILQVERVPIRNENHLINLISTFSVGQQVRLDVWRNRQVIVLDARVGDWAKGQERFRQRSQP